MTYTLVHPNTGQAVTKPLGFSWTTFFFGAFVPLTRGDWKHFFLMCLLCLPTLGLVNFYYMFAYNKMFAQGKLMQGFVPADEQSKANLGYQGIVTK